MKNIFLVLLFVSSIGLAQNLNNYKYAQVPAKFNFLKEANQYNLNTLSKLFMEKYGFVTYFDNEVTPDDFANNNCNKVFVDLIENNTVFTTKIKVVLKDCKNNILFTSEEGTSREKAYKVAYDQALRMAFKSFDNLNHKYNETIVSEAPKTIVEEKIEYKTVPVEIKKEEVVISNTNEVSNSNALYAQPIANGFQLVNTEPKVVYKIYKTSTKDYFIATKGNSNGVLFSRNNVWYFEYYQNDKLISERVEVKF